MLIFALVNVVGTPVFTTLSDTLLSIAQQLGATLMIVENDTEPVSVTAAGVNAERVPGTVTPLLWSSIETSPTVVVGKPTPLKVTK
jgi:hypothetical protein